jgi:hypothetical protein
LIGLRVGLVAVPSPRSIAIGLAGGGPQERVSSPPGALDLGHLGAELR